METINKILKRYRRGKGYTQKQVAAAAGVSQAYYSGVESGKSRLSAWSVLRLEEFYGLKPGEIWSIKNIVADRIESNFKRLDGEELELLDEFILYLLHRRRNEQE
jgi:transcriptional regulator with XRE-family HTH domain